LFDISLNGRLHRSKFFFTAEGISQHFNKDEYSIRDMALLIKHLPVKRDIIRHMALLTQLLPVKEAA
jgi:hypothetical protein